MLARGGAQGEKVTEITKNRCWKGEERRRGMKETEQDRTDFLDSGQERKTGRKNRS